MARTPDRTRLQDFIVTSGDAIVGEDSTTAGGSGTSIPITAGDNPIVAATGSGGSIVLTAGSVTDGASTGNAGSVTLTPGTASGSGSDGVIIVGGSSALQFTEATTVPGPAIAATQGRYWVRDDTPNVPIFTDDAGTDWVLNSSGGGAVETGTPLNNLVAYVDIGDPNSYPGTGTDVVDFQGNLTSGTISGNTVYDNGSLYFEATTGALTFTKNASVDDIFSGGGTIMIFFRVESDGELSAGNWVNTGYDGSGYVLFTENDLGQTTRISFAREFSLNDGIWDFLGVDDVNSRVMRLNSWNSVAIVYDDSSTANVPRMWLNGQPIPDPQIQVTQAPTGVAVTDAGNPLIIGNRAADDRTVHGNLSVFLAWDTAISAETIGTAHSAFMARHGSATGPGATTRKGGDIFIYGGEYVGTGSLGGGSVFISGGTTWSDNNSSFGGSVTITGGNSQDTLAGIGGGGPLGAVIVVGGRGDQESTHTVGDLASIGSEFGGGTLTAGNGPSRTLVRGSDNDGSASGGDLIVRGGDSLSTGTGNAAGGDLALTSGRGRNIQGGNILMRSRGTSGTGSQTGNIYITTQQSNDPFAIFGAQGGVNTGTGNITITTNPVGSTASTGGDITITAASTTAVTGNDPGAITITAGSMSSTTQSIVGGRPVTINGGNSSGDSTSPGGDVILNGGNQVNGGSEAGSPGGSIQLNAGTSVKSNATSGGGAIVASAGNTTGSVSPGGAVTISGGNNTNATGSGAGGTITLNAGDATGATSTGNGGNIILNPGSSVGGTPGEVTINGKLNVTGLIDPTGLVLDEQATVPFSTTAGRGTLWVRNDTPNVVVFTDDAGTDWDLNGGGGGSSLQAAYDASTPATITTNGTTGDLTFTGDQNIFISSSEGSATAISITGTTGSGSGINVVAGSGTASAGGNVFVSAGAGDGVGAGGNITLWAENGGATGNGGAAELAAGFGGATSGNGGATNIYGGNANNATGTGGTITIFAGSGSAGGAAGNIDITCDTGNGGGAITLTSGTGIGGGDGGDVTLVASNGTGVAGQILLSTTNPGSTTTDGSVYVSQGVMRGGGGGGTLPFQILTDTAALLTGGEATTPLIYIAASDSTRTTGSIRVYPGGTSGNVDINGGDVSSGFADGGSIFITAGDTAPLPGGGDGGDIVLTCGAAENAGGGDFIVTTGNSVGTQGGDIVLTLGTCTGGFSGTGGSFFLSANAITDTNESAGIISMTGANVTNAANTNAGGAISLTGGSNTGGAAGAGGAISLTAGNSSGAASGGAISLTAGNAGTLGQGGSVAIAAGNGAGTSGGGDLDMFAGSSATSGVGGFAALSAGAGGTTGAGGQAFLLGGPGGSTSGNGGDAAVSGGTPTDGNGGNVIITGAAGVGINRDGGNITLNPGAATGTGTAGEVTINGKLNVTGGIDPTYLGLNEQASFPTTAQAGIGYLWVRNDTPTTLVYTDDAGTDFDLAGTGLGTLQSAYVNGNTITTDGTNGPFTVSGTENISLTAGGTGTFTSTGAMTVSTAAASAALLTVSAGSASAGTGGVLNLSSGAGATGAGGALNITGGNGSGNFAGGAVTISSGVGGTGGASGSGGALVLFAGGAGAASGANGANVTINAGAADGAGTDGFIFLGQADTSFIQAMPSDEFEIMTALVDVNASGAVTIDAVSASNFTVSGGNLTVGANGSSASLLQTIVESNNGGAGGARVVIDSQDVIMQATNGGVDITATTTVNVDATSAISLDAGAASNFTVTGAALTLSTVTSGDVNVTGADAVNVTAGSEAAAVGNNVTITAGAGGGANAGGNVVLVGGVAGATANGGIVSITGGAGGATSGNGGAVTLSGGTPATEGNGGAASVVGANGVGTNRDGGDVNLTAGNPTGTGTAGQVLVTRGVLQSPNTSNAFQILSGGQVPSSGGDSTTANIVLHALDGSSRAGGRIQLSQSNTGNGAVDILGGDATAGNTTGGAANLNGGDGSGTSAGGQALMQAGTGGSSSGGGGFAFVFGGLAGATNGSGGGVVITGQDANGTGTAGAITVTAGDSGTGATGNGANVTITAGSAASTNGNGGSIVLNPGTLTGTGTDGEVTINGKLTVTGGIDPTYMGFDEQGSFPTSAQAGIGYLWVRNDAPNILVYTDDTGKDFDLAGGSSTRMQEFSLTVATVALDPLGNVAVGLPNGAVGASHNENINSRIQILDMNPSTEDDSGMYWDFVLPNTYSGNGFTCEFWVAGDGTASNTADFAAAFERQNTGFSINAASWATSQTASQTIPGTADITTLVTISFTNAQIDGLLAGESFRFAITRLLNDAYGGVVRWVKGRLYETP